MAIASVAVLLGLLVTLAWMPLPSAVSAYHIPEDNCRWNNEVVIGGAEYYSCRLLLAWPTAGEDPFSSPVMDLANVSFTGLQFSVSGYYADFCVILNVSVTWSPGLVEYLLVVPRAFGCAPYPPLVLSANASFGVSWNGAYWVPLIEAEGGLDASPAADRFPNPSIEILIPAPI